VSDTLSAAPPFEPDGPGRQAVELLYRMVAALELVPTVAVHSVDRDGNVNFWNKRCVELFGVPVHEAVGHPLASLAARVDGEDELSALLRGIWASGRPAPARDWEIERRDGQRRWVHSTHYPVIRDGQPQEIFCMEVDISERKHAETTLALAAQVFDHCRDAIVVIDSAHKVLAVNPAHAALTGTPAHEAIGGELPLLREGKHDPEFYQQLWDYVGEHAHWEGELAAARRDGSEFPAWVSVTCIRRGDADACNYMVILSDITGRKHADAQVRHQAEHDFLTDLPNRVLFLDRLRQALVSARRHHGKLAVMFLDLDRFKGINDGFGHHVGDAVLRETAARLSRCVRGVDTVSRQGGDEFVVILADIGGVDQAAHVAGSVIQAVAQPFLSDELSISLSVSIGIALYPGDGEDVDTLLRHADMAMYHAKQNGRNAFRFFSPEMNAHVVERVQMETSLRHALANDEFELAYQPEIDIASGLTVGVEALIRWHHPQRGLLLPDQFLRVAEECGLILPIGDWVLRTACAQARAWRDRGYPVAVSVNLSHLQFLHDNLVGSVDAALAASGLAPGFLDLEVTEAVIMSGDAHSTATINALRARGVQLTVDNFGTGYSSLSYLRRFPLSKLKIDRSFVDDIERQPEDAAIIPAIIAVARSLKLRVVAEGVETAAQLQFLREHGCDEYQGYYASVALAEPDLTPRPR